MVLGLVILEKGNQYLVVFEVSNWILVDRQCFVYVELKSSCFWFGVYV